MSTIKVDAIQDTSGNGRGTSPAWGRFDCAAPSINDDLNVSSITDVSAGRTDMTFSTAMPDANYGVTGTSFNNSDGPQFDIGMNYGAGGRILTTAVKFGTGYSDASVHYGAVDSPCATVLILN